jgi:hypothetical protein
MDLPLLSLYGVLATQGPIWVLGHCPGMCGPLVIGLRFSGVSAVLRYQAGKAVTYAVLGAAAGAAGGVAIGLLQRFGPALLATVAGLMVLAGLWRLRGGGAAEVAVPAWLGQAVRRFATGQGGPFALGAVLALLPCGVVLWALGLAVASAHPLHGALLMAGLTLFTTPVLVAAHLLGGGRWLATLRQRLRWLPGLTLAASGLWLGWLALHVGAPGCH